MSDQFKLISVDNESTAGNTVVGKTNIFRFDGKRFYFDCIRSSTVSSLTQCEGDLVVTTRNSVYTFKKADNGQ